MKKLLSDPLNLISPEFNMSVTLSNYVYSQVFENSELFHVFFGFAYLFSII